MGSAVQLICLTTPEVNQEKKPQDEIFTPIHLNIRWYSQ